MRGKTLLYVSALLISTSAWAQSASDAQRQASPVDAVRLQTVTVTGIQPGPGLWKVSRGEHVLWVLGTLTPLPKHMKWRSTQVEQVIAQSQELLEPPTAELRMHEGLFNRLNVQSSSFNSRKNPDGASLQQLLPPETFTRWQTLKQQYIGSSSGIEYWRPILVTVKLREKALDTAKLTDTSDVIDTVTRLARKHDVRLTPVKYEMMVGSAVDAAETQRQITQRDIACLDQTMQSIEHDLDTLTVRANAWATGDMVTLRKLAPGNRYDSCVVPVANADFAQRLGLHNLPERMEGAWLWAAQTALTHNAQTFALLPMEQVLAPDGLVGKLKAQGYAVQAPDELE
ncbi:TraB family protein [Dyella sp. OK004]|uniref:TraB/GumN family protein n=1 Tax=Dyella sp. OK004 TaxID=1855292 RepID=UPI0008E28B21|nr:TraB/GumN family protein [Dyella sp. OK004]SFS08888.1 TraB family protein [Dyella sp. OK004]